MKSIVARALRAALAVAVLGFAPPPTTARAADAVPVSPEVAKKTYAGVDKALAYLKRSQKDDGSFADGAFAGPITGLVVAGALKTQRVTVADPMIAKALSYLETQVQKDGGIYAPGGQTNYPTAISLLAFAAADKDGRYKTIVADAVVFLKAAQWDESEGIDEKDPRYGGAGYGGKSKTRPDLSNTAFLLDALDAGGLPKTDPAYERALLFIRRCQNYAGEGGNDLPAAAKIDDGGFYYTPAEAGYNPGGVNPDQSLRSYGSMTYAGLKSFIYAGLKKDDPRVQAAYGWIKKHYTVKENPGLGNDGLYYYYQTFAKALTAMDLKTVTDDKGTEHAWREDLLTELLSRQKEDGSWSNESKKWLENDASLATAFSLLAIGSALGD
ncbi:MAG: prenyltransferase/squalene oxidase repeat-containing protein [Planctomycetia bacterium]